VFGCWGRYLCEWEGYVAMALFLFWERWGLQWSATSDMWWIWWGEHQKSWSHQNGHVINQEMFRIMQRRRGGQMEVCALCCLGFLVHWKNVPQC
jgi:hypothetical protein